MHILILDDEEIRLQTFRQKLIGHVVDCAKTTQETIKFLQEKEYSVLFLDHDLGGKQMVPSGPGTGYEVACWLEAHPERKPKTIYLHSFNEPGRTNMKRALPEAIMAPGAWLTIQCASEGESNV
ncbi:MAG: response regulator [Bacteroidetes bacterium]|nr:response regulator [Bacteroidota bacterium]